MPLNKQVVNVPFIGLDQKSDPFKIAPGKFLNLDNTIPIKGGEAGILLQKRNGYQELGSLPDTTSSYVTTFNDNLVAIGPNVSAYNQAASNWVEKGSMVPLELNTLPLIRSSSNQSQVDTATASNGLLCIVYQNDSPSITYSYAVIDSVTGQNIIAPIALTTAEPARVFLLGNYFIVVHSQSTNLKYIAIPINNPQVPTADTTIVTNYAPAGPQPAFDGFVLNNNLYLAYNGSDMAFAVRMTYLNSFLVRQTSATGVNVANAHSAQMVSVTADVSHIWVSFKDDGSGEGYTLARDPQLNLVLAPTLFSAPNGLLNVTSTALNGVVTIFYEIDNSYSYGSTLPTHFINSITCTTAGTLSSELTVSRSIGLASKAFLIGVNSYVLSIYFSDYQPSYFLMGVSGNVIAKLAYSNGGTYLIFGLPSVTVNNHVAELGYLIKDLIEAANKSQNPASAAPVFSQTGINLASFDFTNDGLVASEIGSNLNISGGLIWAYDGTQLTEQGFNLWPDNVIVTTATTGGHLAADTYFYQAVYEWTDNQGNIQRSAPSIPVSQVTTGTTSENTINVPTLRLTYKSLVKITIYRWFSLMQYFYHVTTIASPVFNDKTADSVVILDSSANEDIVGNSILYTTGGVVEDIGPPASNIMTLFQSRLFLVDAEDRNLLWFSKQVIEATPVEFSDLLTIYVGPTISSQNSTGPITALWAMDDKLIIFKKDAIYYLTGIGPDNTGASNDFSNATFITSTVGCANPDSIAFIPQGLVFQSDKGRWLLGRDLSTSYIGSPAENYNTALSLSAVSVPETNQVRFTLSTGLTLMYDYFFGVWGTFSGVPAISSTIYQGLHTFINSLGEVFQETPGIYLDGSRPVLMSFKTSWFNLAGVQGYQRIYNLYLLGQYYSPHKIVVSIAYDYSPAPSFQTIISPDNYNAPFGSDPSWGVSSPFGGTPMLEQWEIQTERQLCQSFQITLQEIFDAAYGVQAGAGFTLSGLALRLGLKKGIRPIRSANSVG